MSNNQQSIDFLTKKIEVFEQWNLPSIKTLISNYKEFKTPTLSKEAYMGLKRQQYLVERAYLQYEDSKEKCGEDLDTLDTLEKKMWDIIHYGSHLSKNIMLDEELHRWRCMRVYVKKQRKALLENE